MTIDLGSVDQAGSSSGGAATGGAPPQPKTCDDSCAAIGKCESARCLIEENPGQLTPEQQQMLQAGGTSDDQFAWLYPYDATVFPRGLHAPRLQFGGGAGDAFYLHISFNGLDYKGFFGASDPARIQLSAAAWTAITHAAGGADSVKVEVTKLQAGAVTGPISEAWTIASGSLRGALYYDGGAGLFRLKPGDESDQLLVPGAGCVAVSADGSKLVATVGDGYQTYDLRASSSIVKEWQASGVAGCTSLYPDGSLAMVFTPNDTAQFIDPLTAVAQPQAGWPSMTTTAQGSFSPDGKKVVYYDHSTALTLLDVARSAPSFDNRRDFSVENVSGLPDFTPDSASVIYSGKSTDWVLARLDIGSGQSTELALLAGPDSPFNYASATLPLSVGGYYWVVFSSDRAYGNTTAAGGTGQLWVAALDMSASTGDSSHPAFYLDGQDPSHGNRFSQWALEPCQSDGGGCDFGDQCCGGYCRDVSGSKQCLSTPPDSCGNELEHCEAAADCCDKTHKCINHRCAAPKPVK